MKTTSVRVLATLPCSAEVAYQAWMDSAQHAAMTGGSADIDPVVGGYFTIWDGAVTGRTLQLDESIHRITQFWRYDYPDWPEDQPSRLMVTFGPLPNNQCEFQLEHSNIPNKYAKDIKQGWQEYYVEPMLRYFATGSSAQNQ